MAEELLSSTCSSLSQTFIEIERGYVYRCEARGVLHLIHEVL